MQLVTIEYPGVVTQTRESLERALATLSPYAGPGSALQSAPSALAHLAHVLARGGKLIECRLAPLSGEDEAGSLYRHPILGDVVPGHELVVRLRKRVWQRRNAEGHMETRKAYTLTLLGAVRSTVRFVRMADFAFKPDLPAGATTHPTEALHRALVQMNVGALQQFRFAPETEEYEVPDQKDQDVLRSNLAMIPPPFFSRMELPFNYGYRQNPASSLQTVSSASTAKRARKTVRKGQADVDPTEPDARVVTRYLNRSRWRNMAPVAVKFAQSDVVPTGPDEALARVTFSDRHQALLAQLKEVGFWFLTVALCRSPRMVAPQLAKPVPRERRTRVGPVRGGLTPEPRSYLRSLPTRSRTVPGETHLCALATIPGRSPRVDCMCAAYPVSSVSICAAKRREMQRRAAFLKPSTVMCCKASVSAKVHRPRTRGQRRIFSTGNMRRCPPAPSSCVTLRTSPSSR